MSDLALREDWTGGLLPASGKAQVTQSRRRVDGVEGSLLAQDGGPFGGQGLASFQGPYQGVQLVDVTADTGDLRGLLAITSADDETGPEVRDDRIEVEDLTRLAAIPMASLTARIFR